MDRKALNLPILISLVVGNMIGTGIYILPASLAEFGSISIIAWFYTALGALFLALTFANLNKRFPKTGGPYVYCKEAFGKLTGFVIAYIYWISNLVSIAGIAVASVGYLGFLLPALNANTTNYHWYLALAIEITVVWLFTFINILGIHTAGVVQLFLTIVKIIPLLVIIFVGANYIHFENLQPFNVSGQSNLAAMSSAATLTFWAFIGLESATIPAENTRGSADIFKATVYGTLITAFIYILSTFVLMGMLPSAELKNSQFPFAAATKIIFGSASAATFIAICAFISGLGALNVCVLIQGQIVFAAARDHLFPRVFAKLSKHDVPIAAQLLSSSLITLYLILTVEPTLLEQFNSIALFAGLLTLITYFVTTLAEIKFLFLKKVHMRKLFLTKSFLTTVLAATYSTWMLSNFKTNLFFAIFILLILALPIYFFSSK